MQPKKQTNSQLVRYSTAHHRMADSARLNDSGPTPSRRECDTHYLLTPEAKEGNIGDIFFFFHLILYQAGVGDSFFPSYIHTVPIAIIAIPIPMPRLTLRLPPNISQSVLQ